MRLIIHYLKYLWFCFCRLSFTLIFTLALLLPGMCSLTVTHLWLPFFEIQNHGMFLQRRVTFASGHQHLTLYFEGFSLLLFFWQPRDVNLGCKPCGRALLLLCCFLEAPPGWERGLFPSGSGLQWEYRHLGSQLHGRWSPMRHPTWMSSAPSCTMQVSQETVWGSHWPLSVFLPSPGFFFFFRKLSKSTEVL